MGKFFQLLALVCLLQLANCWKNDWDKPLDFDCPKNQVITRIASIHNNQKEDRRYGFTCSSRCSDAHICYWSGYINKFDQRLDFVCPNGGMISGLRSVHSNHHEDRRWRVKCCKSNERKPVNCKLTGWLNNWDQQFNYNLPAGYVIQGIFSFHRNDKEDRIWRLMICQI